MTHRWSKFVVVLLLAVVLTACGTDDSEDEPTATSAAGGAQPTVATGAEDAADATPGSASAESSPANTDMSDVPASVIAESGVATPAIAARESTVEATPGDGNSAAGSPSSAREATPVVSESLATPTSGQDTVATTDVTEGDPIVGDGTTGASVDGAEAATPVGATAIPQASPVAASTPLTVSACDVPSVPEFEGETSTYAITTDVMFRTGPGPECPLALETPLGEFQRVVVIGGPVIREDDGTEWVQLNVNGVEGWVSFDFLEPVS